MKEIMVSIVCLAYNHENYIRDAIEGFLSQVASFMYEIIIHDDASTDRTPEIISEYEKKYPEIIHAIYQKENQYSKGIYNIMQIIYPVCKGKYIACCEGDDFWIDMHKLQIQVDFLEKHLDYALTVHNSIRYDCLNARLEAMYPYDCEKEVTKEEIIMRYHGNIPSASMVMRSEAFKMDDFFLGCDVGDIQLQLHCITKGKVYYFDRVMSVYRFCHEGSWTAAWLNDFERTFNHIIKIISFYEKYNKYTKYTYDKYIMTKIQEYIYTLIEIKGVENIQVFSKMCKEYDKKNNFEYHHILEELKRVNEQVFHLSYYDNQIQEYIEKHRFVLIFGAGHYAAKITEQLQNHDIDFDGYVVSELKDGAKKYLGKPVWNLKDIPFNRDEVGIIIAIKPTRWNELIESLEQYNIIDYICPFLFSMEARNER